MRWIRIIFRQTWQVIEQNASGSVLNAFSFSPVAIELRYRPNNVRMFIFVPSCYGTEMFRHLPSRESKSFSAEIEFSYGIPMARWNLKLSFWHMLHNVCPSKSVERWGTAEKIVHQKETLSWRNVLYLGYYLDVLFLTSIDVPISWIKTGFS